MCLKIKAPYDLTNETKEGEEKQSLEYIHILISIIKNNSEVHAALDKINVDNKCYVELSRDNLSEFNVKVGKTLTDRRFIDWIE